MNKLFWCGNIGSEPEFITTPSGKSLLKFSVAHSEKYKLKTGETKEDTVWMRFEVWGARADGLVNMLTKGTKVAITGSLKEDKWDDKDGNKRSAISARVDQLEVMAGYKPREESASKQPEFTADD